MGIPQEQLEPWAKQGAQTQAQDAYASICAALEEGSSSSAQQKYSVYLQGSYRNRTNIRGDADVDVVVELRTGQFSYDVSYLKEKEARTVKALHARVAKARLACVYFRRSVLEWLRAYYGDRAVRSGRKCITVEGVKGRMCADVLVCVPHRLYYSFKGLFEQVYQEGVMFVPTLRRPCLFNFPKQHFQNGATKNGERHSNGYYKPMIRLFKNARNSLGPEKIWKAVAPSYYIEGLLYNVPDDLFHSNLEESFLEILTWLEKAPMSRFRCQNDIVPLFGGEPDPWSAFRARRFVRALRRLWKNWSP